MAKKVKQSTNNQISGQIIDAGAFLLSSFFVWSVIMNAQDLIKYGEKNAPSSYSLIVALILIGYNIFQRKKINAWSSASLAVLATATIVWLVGLTTSQ